MQRQETGQWAPSRWAVLIKNIADNQTLRLGGVGCMLGAQKLREAVAASLQFGAGRRTQAHLTACEPEELAVCTGRVSTAHPH